MRSDGTLGEPVREHEQGGHAAAVVVQAGAGVDRVEMAARHHHVAVAGARELCKDVARPPRPGASVHGQLHALARLGRGVGRGHEHRDPHPRSPERHARDVVRGVDREHERRSAGSFRELRGLARAAEPVRRDRDLARLELVVRVRRAGVLELMRAPVGGPAAGIGRHAEAGPLGRALARDAEVGPPQVEERQAHPLHAHVPAGRTQRPRDVLGARAVPGRAGRARSARAGGDARERPQVLRRALAGGGRRARTCSACPRTPPRNRMRPPPAPEGSGSGSSRRGASPLASYSAGPDSFGPVALSRASSSLALTTRSTRP